MQVYDHTTCTEITFQMMPNHVHNINEACYGAQSLKLAGALVLQLCKTRSIWQRKPKKVLEYVKMSLKHARKEAKIS